MSPFGPRFAPHAAAHSAQSFDALSAGLADPVGPLEVGEHEDVEQLGAGGRPEGVQAFPEPTFELVNPH